MVELLIVGWDGASQNYLEEYKLEWIDLFDNGGRFFPEELYQGIPIDSGTAWTTIATGLAVEEHGIISINNLTRSKGFLEFTKKISSKISNRTLRTYLFYGPNKLLNLETSMPRASDVPYKRIWDLWSGRTLTVGVPMTYPAWKHDGVMLSGIPSPEKADSLTSYPESYEKYRKRFEAYNYVDKSPLPFPNQPNKQQYVERVYELNEEAFSVVEELDENEDFEMIFAVFPLLDDLMHSFDPEEEQDRIEEAYEWIDQRTSELEQSINPDHTIVISDHGMQPSDESLNPSLDPGVLMDHDSLNGIWRSDLDLDIKTHLDFTPMVLKRFGFDYSKENLEFESSEVTQEEEEEIKKRLENMGYLD